MKSCVQSISAVFMSILFSACVCLFFLLCLTVWTCALATDHDLARVDARSAMAQENMSHVVTRPRMVAEFVVAFTDPRSFWYSGAASLLLDGGICSVIEDQQGQLMYQQEVIDEAGAARTPVPQYAQEY